jgi:flagellar basal body-associated protein FliL
MKIIIVCLLVVLAFAGYMALTSSHKQVEKTVVKSVEEVKAEPQYEYIIEITEEEE